MDKDTLYQKGLKLAQSKGYTGEFVWHFAEEFVQGYEEGRTQAMNEIAAKLKQMGIDEQIISEITGLAVEEV